MPIRPENKARYPRDWKTVVVPRIRARSGNRCECTGQCGHRHVNSTETIKPARCGAWNGYPIDEIEGPKIVLTVAHLGLPARLPFFLHVTRHTVTDEVVDLIGFLVPFDTERLEWRLMMNDRSTSELFRGPPASGAGFFVSLPSLAPSASPSRSVISDAASGPVWVKLSAWSLIAPPLETANVAAETSTRSQVIAAEFDGGVATLAPKLGEPPLRPAYGFTATGIRTSFAAIRRLLRCDWEINPTEFTGNDERSFARATHGSLYHMDDYPENCSDENLLHMCQGCHNRYDAPHRAAGIKARRRALNAAGDLFCEETT